MGILDLFKKKKLEEKQALEKKKVAKPKVKAEKPKAEKEEKPIKKEDGVIKKVETKSAQAKGELKGKTQQAYRVLVKPLVTEKAADLGAYGQYVFAIDPKMNKIEVKKAIRTIYGVDPVKVNILNVSGKAVRYGQVWGKTKNWKKAVVTLKPGDKIEIYEGV